MFIEEFPASQEKRKEKTPGNKIETEQQINKIQRKYEVLIQESNDVFAILSPDGTISFMSEAAKKVIGYSPEEKIGKKIYDYYEGTGQVCHNN